MTEAGDLETTPEEAQDGASPGAPPNGMSPYATGGGGVTFERKVAVTYLAHLLVGDGAAELGDERRVVSVAFQQALALHHNRAALVDGTSSTRRSSSSRHW